MTSRRAELKKKSTKIFFVHHNSQHISLENKKNNKFERTFLQVTSAVSV